MPHTPDTNLPSAFRLSDIEHIKALNPHDLRTKLLEFGFKVTTVEIKHATIKAKNEGDVSYVTIARPHDADISLPNSPLAIWVENTLCVAPFEGVHNLPQLLTLIALTSGDVRLRTAKDVLEAIDRDYILEAFEGEAVPPSEGDVNYDASLIWEQTRIPQPLYRHLPDDVAIAIRKMTGNRPPAG